MPKNSAGTNSPPRRSKRGRRKSGKAGARRSTHPKGRRRGPIPREPQISSKSKGRKSRKFQKETTPQQQITRSSLMQKHVQILLPCHTPTCNENRQARIRRPRVSISSRSSGLGTFISRSALLHGLFHFSVFFYTNTSDNALSYRCYMHAVHTDRITRFCRIHHDEAVRKRFLFIPNLNSIERRVKNESSSGNQHA